jgi:hypothetical protein
VSDSDKNRCRWFQWIGGPYCDRCGREPLAHAGIEWYSGGPFAEDRTIHVLWPDYGPGQRLNVPLFTAYHPEVLDVDYVVE